MAQPAAGDRSPQIVAISGTMITLVTVAVALRIWGRHAARQAGLWWDDWLSLAALVSSVLLVLLLS